MKENPKSHRSTPKVDLNLPDVLQNPQFTLFHYDDNKNPTKTQRRRKNTSKTPQTRTESEEKTTKTKKFPRKPPETHLIFSKTHNPLLFNFTTNENSTKHNGHPKTRHKHPKQEQDQTQKRKKNTKAKDPPQKSP